MKEYKFGPLGNNRKILTIENGIINISSGKMLFNYVNKIETIKCSNIISIIINTKGLNTNKWSISFELKSSRTVVLPVFGNKQVQDANELKQFIEIEYM